MIYSADMENSIKPFFSHLHDFSVIQISGPDAAKFLQGQITCDINELNDTRVILAACCDAKGRIQANFWAWKKADVFYLSLPKSMSEILQNHLKKYAVFSKIHIENMDSIFKVTGIYVEEPSQISAEMFLQIPGEMTRFLAIDKNYLEISQLEKRDNNHWKLLNIFNQTAFIYPATMGEVIPQMINLQLYNGISFSKGCYLGQEIIARTQHLGTLKRHLHRAHLQSDTQPQPGDIIEKNNSAGLVLDSAINETGSFELLVIIHDQALIDSQHPFKIGPHTLSLH